MLFLGAAVVNPTVDEAKKGGLERVVVELKLVVAKDEASARVQITRAANIEKNEEDRLEVRVVPFAK